MKTRYFALAVGILFTLVGIAGFIPGLRSIPADSPDMAVHASYGYLFGLFPVNALHNLVHLILGIWGMFAFARLSSSRIYAQSLTIIYGLLAVMGLFPVLRTTFGLVPLFGHDIWLHAVTALVAAYFGYVAVEGRTTTSASYRS